MASRNTRQDLELEGFLDMVPVCKQQPQQLLVLQPERGLPPLLPSPAQLQTPPPAPRFRGQFINPSLLQPSSPLLPPYLNLSPRSPPPSPALSESPNGCHYHSQNSPTVICNSDPTADLYPLLHHRFSLLSPQLISPLSASSCTEIAPSHFSSCSSSSPSPSSTLTSLTGSPLSSPSHATSGFRRPDIKPVAKRLNIPSQESFLEEDVLIMDGFLVSSDQDPRSKSDPEFSPSSYYTPPPLRKSVFCTGACEEAGHPCSFHYAAAACEVPQGKEELRRRRNMRHRHDVPQICKSFARTGECIYGDRCRNIHVRSTALRSAASPSLPEVQKASSPVRILQLYPSSASKDATDGERITPPARSKRLPVFEQICPSGSSSVTDIESAH